MASFKILVIAISNINYTLDERTGFYTNTHGDQKGIYDFLTSSPVLLKTVKDTERDLTFEIGSVVTTISGNAVRNVVSGLFVVQNRLHLQLNGGTTLVPANQYKYYVEPVTVIPSTTTTSNNQELENTTRLQEIEDRILRSDHASKLKLDRYVLPNNMTFRAFVVNFLRNSNIAHSTVYVSGTREGLMQTPTGRRRSIGDIFKICKFYYPNCKLVDLAKILYLEKFENNSDLSFIGTLKCQTIHKRVWWNNGQHRISHDTDVDEYDMTFANWISEIKTAINNAKTKKSTVVSKFTPKRGDYVIAKESSIASSISKGYQYPVMSTSGENVTVQNDIGSNVTLEISKFDPSYLEQAKIKFPKGAKIKTVSGNTVTIDTTNFEDTGRNIIQISSAGSRRIVYSKEQQAWAKKM